MGTRLSEEDVTFVTTTCPKDAHYCRALLASIRNFYPHNRVVVILDKYPKGYSFGLPGIEHVCSSDLAGRLDLPITGTLNKMALFFWDDAPAYLYMDADSVLVGPVLSQHEVLEVNGFVALDGQYLDPSLPDSIRLLDKYAFNPEQVRAELDPSFRPTSVIYFSSGHFVVRRGSIPEAILRSQFELINSDWSRRGPFRFNDQGYLNFVVNWLSSRGCLESALAHCTINGKRTVSDRPAVRLANVLRGDGVGAHIIHYTGPSRRLLLQDHSFGDILTHFHMLYYRKSSRTPALARLLDETSRVARYQYRRVAGRASRLFRKP